MKLFTLVMVWKESQILLGLKKRGFGVGKWNGFGGKIEAVETVMHAAARELYEESGIVVKERNLIPCGIMDMYFPKGEIPIKIFVFRCHIYEGEIVETEEMKPKWFNVNDPPYDFMWKEARIWYPFFLSKTNFYVNFSFAESGEVKDHKVVEGFSPEMCKEFLQ